MTLDGTRRFKWREFDVVMWDDGGAYNALVSDGAGVKSVRVHKNPASPIRFARTIKLAGEQLRESGYESGQV